ncbi:MAG TPA: 50S ribosomal protein L29 [Terriglobales bacterium]|nr:50S ribosomal protein L29 [Terriglobales bacterium]
MEAEKLRNLTNDELLHQQRELNDQLFRMKFQLKMGQTESLNKLRGLRKDVARIKTILREKDLGLTNGATAKSAAPESGAAAEQAPAKRAAKRSATKKTKKKSSAKKSVAKKASSAKAKAKARK